jgi:hypothetical protein
MTRRSPITCPSPKSEPDTANARAIPGPWLRRGRGRTLEPSRPHPSGLVRLPGPVAVGNGETVGVQACAYSDIAKRGRDLRQRAEFRRIHPCPATRPAALVLATSMTKVKPLCAGGRRRAGQYAMADGPMRRKGPGRAVAMPSSRWTDRAQWQTSPITSTRTALRTSERRQD